MLVAGLTLVVYLEARILSGAGIGAAYFDGCNPGGNIYSAIAMFIFMQSGFKESKGGLVSTVLV